MISMINKGGLLSICLVLFTACLMLSSCDKDDDGPATGGDIMLSPSNPSYEGPRGTDVLISVDVSAEDGISTLSATPEGQTGQTVNVPAGTTNTTAEVTFTIPPDAILGTNYSIDFQVEDMDGDQENLEVVVSTSPVLSEIPSTYTFDRQGNSTVSYSGQNDRLDMVEEIKAYLQEGDSGTPISAQVLNDAYANTGDNGNGFFSFSSDRQLKNKTFQPDLDENFMENLFAGAEAASQSGAAASDGTAGLLVRENSGKTVLVDANGREFTQIIEKGLMGTVMYNQIFNTYFSDDRIGDDVENTELKEGSHFTDMEHHWDEAFGYWNPPLDFSSDWPDERGSEDRFWSHYSNVVDPFLGTNDLIMQGFLEGRTAIVNNDLETKNSKRVEVAENLEVVAAATAVHYINSTLSGLNEGKTGEAFHTLSEAWAFVNAIKYYPDRKLDPDQLEKIKEEDFGSGGNFWNVTAAGLQEAKSTIVSAYPVLADVQDEL